MPTINLLCGAAAAASGDVLADLRLEIFREYPYLYDGCRENELVYVRHYSEVPDACLLTATVDGVVVGAASGMPLAHEDDELRLASAGAGLDVASLYYVGELLLLPAYRGEQLGSQLFARLERQVHTLQRYRGIVCATVVRPEDHPLRPVDYLPIERFLARHAFRVLPGVTASFAWQELDGVRRDHPMQLWLKELA